MCGIAGAAWVDGGPALSDETLRRMTDRIAHRGPDDAWTHRDGHAALGFRRLAIIDVAGARQPLSNEDGTVWTVFNGEIYNFPALRRRLEARGHDLRTKGDTEVLVHLYEDEGVGMFEHLRGMFALAIWDAPRRTLVLGRDRLGQKPLVYRHDGRRLVFASELKALLTLPEAEMPRRVCPKALDRYLTYGYIGAPDTILEGVYKLPPAHYAVWHEGALTMGRYWSPDWNAEADSGDPDEGVAQLREMLADAVREQMMADVPLGAFLSGGIDSTIIVGLMQRASDRPVKTFSIGFDDPAFDETGYAETAAKFLGTEHHAFRIEPKAWEAIPSLADQFDEPFADSSALPTWYVSRETRREVTVALTGDAGDELFAGYDRYRALALSAALDRLPAGARGVLSGPVARSLPVSVKAKTRLRSLRRWLEAINDPLVSRYLKWVQMFDEPTRLGLYSDAWLDTLARPAGAAGEDDPVGMLADAFEAAGKRDVVTRATVADLLTYLPGDLLAKVDLASMAHSLECRGPFLDHRVVELAVSLPLRRKLRLRGGRSKVVLKEAFADLLPPTIRNRPKMGFGVPLDRWFRGPLKDELTAVLLDDRALSRGLFRPEAIRQMVAEHVDGRRDHAYKLWGLLMLELWFRHQIDR